MYFDTIHAQLIQCLQDTATKRFPHNSSSSFRYGASFQYLSIVTLNLSFPGAGDVWFSFNGTTYQNNSIVRLEDIGEGDNVLLCRTNQTACCRPPYTSEMGSVSGNWFFPNGTRVPSVNTKWGFYRTRGQMVVRMYRRRGGVEGIYRCEIADALNVTQTIYIGVYSANTGEWSCSVITPQFMLKKCQL